MDQRIHTIFDDHIRLTEETRVLFAGRIVRAAADTVARLRQGGRIYLLGNGGSAADALHWAGELMGRFLVQPPRHPRPRPGGQSRPCSPPWPTTWATTPIFLRQLDTLARLGDVVFALSTSGTSANVLAALRAVADRGCFRVGFTGSGGGEMGPLVDVLFDVPSRSTPRVQEIHALLGHILCELIEVRNVR